MYVMSFLFNAFQCSWNKLQVTYICTHNPPLLSCQIQISNLILVVVVDNYWLSQFIYPSPRDNIIFYSYIFWNNEYILYSRHLLFFPFVQLLALSLIIIFISFLFTSQMSLNDINWVWHKESSHFCSF